MANVRVVVKDDDGEIIADYILNNGEVDECLEDADNLREHYYNLTGIMLEPVVEPPASAKRRRS